MAQQIAVFKMKIADSPGSLAAMLDQAAGFGLDLAGVCATGGEGSQAVLFAVPKDAGVARRAASAGGSAAEECAGFLLEGEDKIGAGAAALKPLAQANIDLLACAAFAKEGRYQALVVVKSEDAATAAEALGAS